MGPGTEPPRALLKCPSEVPRSEYMIPELFYRYEHPHQMGEANYLTTMSTQDPGLLEPED